MSKVMTWLSPYLARFDALAERERIAVGALFLVSVALFFYLLLLEPMILQADALNKQINNTKMQTQASEQQIAVLQKRLQQDPNLPNQQLLVRLQAQKQKIDEQLQGTMDGLIAPAQMAQVLEAVLTQTTALKLEKLNNLPVRPLIEDKQNEKASVLKDVGVYRHGLQIEFRGSYLQMLAYLKALQSLPWSFYWGSIELNMERYPQAQIVMTVHTLSFTPGWIGV